MHLEGDDLGDDAWKAFKGQGKLKATENLGACIRLISPTLDSLFQSDALPTVMLDQRVQSLLNEMNREPVWLDWDLIKRGQELFKRYEISALLGLLCYSLVGGFTSPRIVGVLYLSSDLSKSRDKTFRRLVETLDMVLSCMESPRSLKPGHLNPGWRHALRTRLIHSCVRVRLTSKPGWDKTKSGVPINQEDLICTLFTFSYNILKVMRFLGAPMSDVDEHAYLHTWRYIGYLIGIKEEYNPCTSIKNMDHVFENIIRPNLSFADQSQAPSGILARQVLHAASDRYPVNVSYPIHSEYARAFLGSQHADALGIEKFWFQRIIVWLSIWWLRFWSFCIVSRLSIDNPIFHRMCSKHKFFLNYHLAKVTGESED